MISFQGGEVHLVFAQFGGVVVDLLADAGDDLAGIVKFVFKAIDCFFQGDFQTLQLLKRPVRAGKLLELFGRFLVGLDSIRAHLCELIVEVSGLAASRIARRSGSTSIGSPSASNKAVNRSISAPLVSPAQSASSSRSRGPCGSGQGFGSPILHRRGAAAAPHRFQRREAGLVPALGGCPRGVLAVLLELLKLRPILFRLSIFAEFLI